MVDATLDVTGRWRRGVQPYVGGGGRRGRGGGDVGVDEWWVHVRGGWTFGGNTKCSWTQSIVAV